MCDFGHDHDLPPLPHDEWVLDTPRVREFVGTVRQRVATAADAAAAVAAIEPLFVDLLNDREWLPPQYQERAETSRMGAGIGQWLLFRAADRSLSLFSLVVPTGASTPIHDHLAWGLVGLYRGNQDEEFYAPREGGIDVLRQRPLEPGDYYALLPPRDDVHRVRTTSDVTSVSIHLLANDTGCVMRHTFDAQTGAPAPFQSGYVNADCEI